MKTLILGASGQLGQCLVAVSAVRNIDFLDFLDEHYTSNTQVKVYPIPTSD